MARNGFKNGRPRGRRSGPARIVKQNLLRKVSSIFRLPMFTSGSSGSSSSGPSLLLEDGSGFLLLEDGTGVLLLES